MPRKAIRTEEQVLRQVRLGRFVAACRDEFGLKGVDVARACEIGQAQYCEIEKGRKGRPDPRFWILLADKLKLDRGWLLREAWLTYGLGIELPEDSSETSAALLEAVLRLFPSEPPLGKGRKPRWYEQWEADEAVRPERR